jgi:hypothetical protein
MPTTHTSPFSNDFYQPEPITHFLVLHLHRSSFRHLYVSLRSLIRATCAVHLVRLSSFRRDSYSCNTGTFLACAGLGAQEKSCGALLLRTSSVGSNSLLQHSVRRLTHRERRCEGRQNDKTGVKGNICDLRYYITELSASNFISSFFLPTRSLCRDFGNCLQHINFTLVHQVQFLAEAKPLPYTVIQTPNV